MDTPFLELELKVIPNAKKQEILSFEAGRLKVKVRAPPDEGRANKELISFLADFFEIKERQIHLVRGEKSRIKRVRLENVRSEEMMRRLKPLRST